jgi:GntR family transcriptional regulator, transcriptional repressor for pyruvate dehydrogenase complex
VDLPHRSLPEFAADAVIDLIVTEHLNEGDPLPSSAELADRFKVSGVVIREALAILSARGVLSRRQGREAVVTMPGHRILTDVWRTRAKLDSIDVEEFLQCRAALELQAAALAARGKDPGHLREHLEAMRRATSSDEFNAADVSFHLEIARLSGNRAIETVLQSLQSIVYEAFTYGLDRVQIEHPGEGTAQVAELHAAILSAVIRGNPKRAAKAMGDHFAYSVPSVLQTW